MAKDLIGAHLGQYEIVSLLGRGGMAAVYRARQTRLNREVAIKVIQAQLAERPDFLRRFEREAQTIASLSHPQILQVFDYGQHEDIVYLVMPLVTGGTLAELIQRGPMSAPAALSYLRQIGAALDYAHGKSIIHRDLKPQNVLLDTDGNAFLSDFGVAKLMGDQSAITQTGVAMGTPAYMSPEQWRGGGDLDGRVDIYALGVMTFEMLTGQLPYSADTPYGMMHKHIFDPVPSVREFKADLPPLIESVIYRAIAKDRDERFSSAKDFVASFADALNIDLPATGENRAVDLTGPAYIRPPTGTQPKMMTRSEAQTHSVGSKEGTLRPAQSEASPKGGLPLPLIGAGAVILILIGVIAALIGSGGGAQTPTPAAVNPTVEAATPTPSAVPETPTPQVTSVPLALGAVRRDAQGVEQVWVPVGCFTMGSDQATDQEAAFDEQPAREVCITKGFWMDAYEVTNAAFQRFVAANGYQTREYWSEDGWRWLQSRGIIGPRAVPESASPQQPRVGISWYEAEAYARWRGGRLPTEAEWEFAARGTESRIFPWGKTYQNGLANLNESRTAGNVPNAPVAVGSFEGGRSWVGAYDMAGNVSEWVADWYQENYYASGPKDDPTGPPSGTNKVLRGGTYSARAPGGARAAARSQAAPGGQYERFGFRVVSAGQ